MWSLREARILGGVAVGGKSRNLLDCSGKIHKLSDCCPCAAVDAAVVAAACSSLAKRYQE